MKTSRRKFISDVSLGALGLPLVLRKSGIIPPSDTVRIAHIGMGPQGNAHMGWFNALPDVQVVALCDVDKTRLEETAVNLKKINPAANPGLYTDFREITDRKDIDAITCATPDHWHALVAVTAFESGKDVYGEKPLTYSLAEGRAMLKSLERNKSIFQLGTQIHAGENYHRVAELIKSGILGRVHTVRLWKTGGSPGLGFPPNQAPPETLDWNRWLGPAPWSDYTPARCHGTYRHFLDYSGGVFADFWCHIADIMYWSIEPTGLDSIESRGERPTDGIADAPAWIDVDFKFRDLDVFWTTTPPPVPGADKMHIGAHFIGEKGTLTCDYNTRIITFGNESVSDLSEVPQTLPRSKGHPANFIEAVKSRQQPESNLAYARIMTLPMHLAIISFRLKKKLQWDSTKEQFIDCNEANDLLFREYRKPWKINKT
jgi:predicted dehydrogenase